MCQEVMGKKVRKANCEELCISQLRQCQTAGAKESPNYIIQQAIFIYIFFQLWVACSSLYSVAQAEETAPLYDTFSPVSV